MSTQTRKVLPRKVKQDRKCDSGVENRGATLPSPKNSTPPPRRRASAAQPASPPRVNHHPETTSTAAAAAPVPSDTHDMPDMSRDLHDKRDDVTSPEGIARYFHEATEKFERMIKKAVDSLIENIKQVETHLGQAIEFESRRVTEVENRNLQLEKRMGELEKEVSTLRSEVERHNSAINKSERFSRRNNIRIVGIPESTNADEDCTALVENITKEKFGLDIKVERAHRDGKASKDRPRHILFKTLSYREKVDIMKNQRLKLAKEAYFMTDDLTADDLAEKRKWSTAVQELYKNGVKLRFFAGKWRNRTGVPHIFLSSS
ncbi:uncharacterized protein [Diadema setosum]|uniref:uncharacterized protein n=1 Tax=Diadema setosum TaxID=31175 RepID=UPI003B3BE020